MQKALKKYFAVFTLPTLIAFAIAFAVPFIMGIYLSFCDFTTVTDAKWVGIENYIKAFGDVKFWQSLLLTIIFTGIAVLLVNYIAFHLARLVTKGVRFQNFYRASFFTPNLIGGVVLGYIWQFIFGRVLVAFGKSLDIGFLSKSWLSDTKLAMAALILVTVWQYSGYMMLIYIAGLMNVPKELLEAGKIDGCDEKACRKYIVMPMMISSFIICIFLTITRCFMTYDLNFSLTEGNPFGSTVMASMYVYRKAFSEKNYGLGQTEAILLFVVCAFVSLMQIYFTKKKEVQA